MSDTKLKKETDSAFEVIAPTEFKPAQAGRRSGFAGVSWWTLASVGLALLVAAVAIFLFTARSVLVEVDPLPEELAVEGGLLPLKFGQRWLLHPGGYAVKAQKAGYVPLEATFDVTSAEGQAFSFSLEKLPGFLNVDVADAASADVTVEGAHIWLDGQPLSPAPLVRHSLPPGDYDLTVRAPLYRDFSTSVTIEGAEVEQTLAAVLEPAWGDVALVSVPEGATLYVDGDPVGETPLTAKILEGDRELALRLEGYKDWTSGLGVSAGSQVQLPEVALEPADTLISVASSPGGASVTVDGEYRGQTPLRLALAPGRSYRFGFTRAGYQTNSRVLDVVEGDETRLNVRLQPILGSVQVAGQPADAEVFVEGVFKGRLNERFELAAHPQRVEIRKEGFQSYSTTVTPNPDQEQLINVDLLSFAAAAAAKNPDLWTTPSGYALKLIRPSGVYRLGSPRREQGRRSNEFVRQVQLERPFYLGTKEVSNIEYKAFAADHDSGIAANNSLALKDQPVVRISWNDAARFCNWLSAQEGLPAAYVERDDVMVAVTPINTGYRLPTEAEWAYVARYGASAQAARKYPWGAQMPPPAGAGNFAGTESSSENERPLSNYSDTYAATAPVGKYGASTLGLYDLGGNVHEWMHDYYLIQGGGLGKIPLDPMGPAQGNNHVIRGSSWRSGSITELRLAWRDQGSGGRDDIGFRVARYIDESQEGSP
ncbi:MAG: PEGA domain-containing protein [Pseudomonadota bacterium]